MPKHICACELCTFGVCNGHYTPEMCTIQEPKCVWAATICVWVSLDTFKLGNWVGMRKEMQQDFCLACI